MRNFALFIISLLALYVFYPHERPVMAQDKTQAKEELSQDIGERIKEASKARKESTKNAFDLIESITEGKTAKQKQHFTIMYTNYNLIETVRSVQKDVDHAIQQCGEKNPQMKTELDNRFNTWNAEINPLIIEAEKNLMNMVFAQDYAPRTKIDEVFNLISESRKHANSQISKIPVTTPEACTYLQNKMDETQETMANLLQQTLISFPKMFSAPPQGQVKDTP